MFTLLYSKYKNILSLQKVVSKGVKSQFISKGSFINNVTPDRILDEFYGIIEVDNGRKGFIKSDNWGDNIYG